MRDLEKKILIELKYGRKSAFEYVFKTYYCHLCRYAEELLRDRCQAEDVVTNIFVLIWEDRSKINIHTSIRSYLYQSTYNSCINLIRKRQLENKYREFFFQHNSSANHDYGSRSYPLSSIIEKEFEKRINETIEELPSQCKKIFLLSRVDELSHKEIAEELNISVNTVKAHVMTALKRIQVVIKEML